MRVLVSPHVSEKSTRIADESNQVTFRVLPDATKLEIKKAVEKMFSVKVETVRTASYSGKRKGFQRRMGKRPDWKKAFVRLAPGNDIDFLGAD